MSASEDRLGDDFGFLSSARTLVRLNLLSPRFFPLPQGLQELPKSAWQVNDPFIFISIFVQHILQSRLSKNSGEWDYTECDL